MIDTRAHRQSHTNENRKPYPSYKDSQHPWIGQIPVHWEVVPLKRAYTVKLGKMLSPVPSTGKDTLEPYVRAANLQWTGVDVSDIKEMWLSPQEKATYSLKAGDLLVSEGGDVGRSAIWNRELPDCYFQNAVNRVRTQGKDSTHFLLYWLYTFKHTGFIDDFCDRATIRHLTAEKLNVIPVPSAKSSRTVTNNAVPQGSHRPN